MRVLWLSHSARLGGAERALAEGVDALRRLGHETHVVLPEDGALRERLRNAASVGLVHSNCWMNRELPSLIARTRQLIYNFRRAAGLLASLAEARRIDVVFTNTLDMPAGLFAARRMGLPHVWYIHEYGEADHGRRFHWGRRLSLCIVGRLSERVLVNSEALRRYYEAFIPASKIRVVPYSVDIPEMPDAARSGNGPFRMVLVGNKTPGKGQADAVRAVAEVVADGYDVTLDLIGGCDPAYEAELRLLVADLDLRGRVRFVGFDPEPLKWMAQADVALICSRSEAFGRVTVEAMKMGRPVIGARSGATPELVRDGENGLLYTFGRPEELAQRIEVLYQNRKLVRLLGERARGWASERFTIERYGRALAEALGEAVAGRPRELSSLRS